MKYLLLPLLLILISASNKHRRLDEAYRLEVMDNCSSTQSAEFCECAVSVVELYKPPVELYTFHYYVLPELVKKCLLNLF